MPPTFQESSFLFEAGEQVPEHIEDWPHGIELENGKFWLRGTDTFSYEDYVVAVNVGSIPFRASAWRRVC